MERARTWAVAMDLNESGLSYEKTVDLCVHIMLIAKSLEIEPLPTDICCLPPDHFMCRKALLEHQHVRSRNVVRRTGTAWNRSAGMFCEKLGISRSALILDASLVANE